MRSPRLSDASSAVEDDVDEELRPPLRKLLRLAQHVDEIRLRHRVPLQSTVTSRFAPTDTRYRTASNGNSYGSQRVQSKIGIDARDNDHAGTVFPEDVAQHVGDFAQRGTRLDGREDRRQQVVGARAPPRPAPSSAARVLPVARRARTAVSRAICAASSAGSRRCSGGGGLACAASSNRLTPTIDARAALDRALVLEGAPLDLALREARLDRRDHAAHAGRSRRSAPSARASISRVSASTA